MIALSTAIEIGCDDAGTGPAVVFLHGFPHHRSLWAPQLGAFVDQCRCIAPGPPRIRRLNGGAALHDGSIR